MIILTVIDNSGGLLFNHRRVSKDRVLRERILDISQNSRLLMVEYSAKQFVQPLPSNIIVADYFLNIAQAGEYVFVEDCSILPYANKIEKMYLFR